MDKHPVLLKKGLAVGIFVLLAISSVMPLTGSLLIKKQISINDEISKIPGNTRGNTLYVGGSGPGNYTKIQDAIDDANEGDTIFIYNDSSPYYENVYIDDKENIKLIGEDTNTTIIDAGGGEWEWAISVSYSNGFSVSNLTLQNVTIPIGTNLAFFAQHSDDMSITNCLIRDSINGMALQYCANTFMRNNRFENNTMNFDLSGWLQASDFYNDIDTSNTINGKPMYNLVDESDIVLDGIDIGWLGIINCTNITVKNITITDNGENILFVDTKDSTVTNCSLYNSSKSGLYLGFDSDNNSIENCQVIDGINFISNNKNTPNNNTVSNCNILAGVSFQHSHYNYINNCDINLTFDKPGKYSFIHFTYSNHNTISNCTIYNSTEWDVGCSISFVDLFDPFSNYNDIIDNKFWGFSGNALELLFNADFNNIIRNRFTNSGKGIYISSSYYNNEFNRIYHNTFINNSINAYDTENNYWNSSYPIGGNYWDDHYGGGDEYRGPNQDIPGSDGIIDIPKNISGGNNKDYYPLMYEWGENPPFADFTYKVDNYSAVFNASSSFDRDGTVVSYDWDFGDGTNGTGMIISHTYSENKTYEVELIVDDNDGKQGVFSKWIRTNNQAPYDPFNPTPDNGSTSVDVNADLSWECGDPEGDPINFNVYFEADNPSPDVLVSENQTSSDYKPGKMNYSTDYYWQIEVWDVFGASTIGPVWNFTTEPNAPPRNPRNPEPPSGAIDVDVNANLSWECSDPDGDDLIYDVYFEAEDPTPDELVSANQSEEFYNPGKMNYNTTYYWQIVAWDIFGLSSTGPVWNFTTGMANNPPYKPSDPNPNNGSTSVDVDVNLSWSGGDPDEDDTVVYDVYLEADDQTPDVKIAANIIDTWFCPNTLKYNTTYYWQIVAEDNHYTKTKGSVWHFTTEVNMPPSAPIIDGPSSGKTGQNYYYYVNSTDPENHLVFYYVNWGDGTNTDWSGPYISGKKTSFQHAWEEKGTYLIKVKAKDTLDSESDWSEFEVSIPRTKIFRSPLFNLLLERFPLLERLLNSIYNKYN